LHGHMSTNYGNTHVLLLLNDIWSYCIINRFIKTRCQKLPNGLSPLYRVSCCFHGTNSVHRL